MFTKWEQVEAWIKDNNFAHWVFYKTNPADGEGKSNNIIADSNYYGDDADKLEMTRKYLMAAGCRAWGVGFRTPNSTTGGTVCEVRLEDVTPAMPVNGMGYAPQPIDEDKIAQRIEAKLRAEYERKEYERKLADLEKREKEFQEKQNSAMGALTHYFAPIGQALLQRGMRNVAGVDTEEPVHAPAIQPLRQEPDTQEPQEPEEEEVFTEEESERLFDLMKRFKAVEPQYLELIEGVVKMKESGNPMYETAKSFLLK